jgi:hypothetical protein
MELEFKYTVFSGIHPYIGTILATDEDPMGRGDNGFILGFYIPFR